MGNSLKRASRAVNRHPQPLGKPDGNRVNGAVAVVNPEVRLNSLEIPLARRRPGLGRSPREPRPFAPRTQTFGVGSGAALLCPPKPWRRRIAKKDCVFVCSRAAGQETLPLRAVA